MGAGIAQVGAQTGHKVTLVDLSSDVSIKQPIILATKTFSLPLFIYFKLKKAKALFILIT